MILHIVVSCSQKSSNSALACMHACHCQPEALHAPRFHGAVGPEVNPHMVSLLYPVERNLKAVAVALNKPLRWVLSGQSLSAADAAHVMQNLQDG